MSGNRNNSMAFNITLIPRAHYERYGNSDLIEYVFTHNISPQAQRALPNPFGGSVGKWAACYRSADDTTIVL